MDNDEELDIFDYACKLFHSLPTTTHKLMAIEAMEYIYSRHKGSPFAMNTSKQSTFCRQRKSPA